MNRPRRSVVLPLLALACLLPARPVAGQSMESASRLRGTLSSLADSSRIRLAAPGVVVRDGYFLGLGADSLLVAEADARFRVGLDEIEDLSVQGSRWLSVGAQVGAVGLVAGAAAGFFLGYFHCGDDVQECGPHARRVGMRWGMVFGTAGALAGGVAGSRIHIWRQVFP